MTQFFAKVSALKKFTPGVLAANTGITADTWAAGNDPRITGALAANDLGAAIADLAMSEATPLNETLAAAVEREVAIAGQFLVVGAAAVFTATMNGGTWDPSIRLRITDHADAEQAFTPSLIETFDGPWSLATWELTIEQVAAIRGTKTGGSLEARITTGTGDALRPWAAGRISIVSAYVGSSAAQSLGTVTLGPHGPAIASGVVDEDGGLSLTLENGVTLAPIQLPPVISLAIDGDGDYVIAAGTNYVLTPDADGDYIVREIA